MNELGTKPIVKLLITLSIPTILAQIINVLYNIVDRMYIGHIQDIGSLALTGLGVCMPITLCISAFTALMAYGAAPLASIKMGEKDIDTAEVILGNSVTLLIISSFILTIFILLYAKPVLLLFGASKNTIIYALDYIHIYCLGTIFVSLSLGLNVFIAGQGFTKISMFTTLIGAICNIILDPIFIFLFHLNVQGAALATVLSQAISCIWVIKFLTGNKTILKIKLKNLKLNKKLTLQSLSLGSSPFIMTSTESILSVCFNSSLLLYGGDIAVGAMSILSSIMQFAFLPLQGLNQGAQSIISYNYGAKNYERVRKTCKLAITCCLIFTFIIWSICEFTPGILVSLFTNNIELKNYAIWALRIYMGGIIIFGAQIACQRSFVALGNAKTSLFLALLRKVFVLIPLIYILPHFLNNKVFAVLLAEPIADLIAACVTSCMFYRYYKKNLSD